MRPRYRAIECLPPRLFVVARGGDDDRVERDVRRARCGDDDGVHDLHICFCGVVGYSRGAGKETARDDEKGDGEDGGGGDVVFVAAGECCFHVYLLKVVGGCYVVDE